MPSHFDPQTMRYLIFGAVLAVVILLRVRGTRRARRLRLETLWILPGLYALALGAFLFERPPHGPAGWLWLALAALVGGVAGWQRGKLMRISVDPETHLLNQQGSPAAVIFILALIVLRQGLRYEAAAAGIDILTITGVLMAFVLGLLAATRTEMYLRAQRLLDEARAARPA